jgi:hypothetical protein
VPAATLLEIERLAAQYGFLHWHVAFPDVFHLPRKDEKAENARLGWSGGFDVVLANPPWERVKIQEKEWFAQRNPVVAGAANAAARKRLIETLKTSEPDLYREFHKQSRTADGESHFIRSSKRFPLCGHGDINTYAVFAEAMRDAIAVKGRVGCIVPSGIATDETKKQFIQSVIATRTLASLFQFLNKGFFPEVRDAQGNRFCLLTLTGLQAPVEKPDLVFSAWRLTDLHEDKRHFTLTAEDVKLLNPNTGTLPVFQSFRDAEITKLIYRNIPIFVGDAAARSNEWGVSFMRMLDMANDSDAFLTRGILETRGARLKGNVFVSNDGRWLPLFEAKMIHHFDHRFGDYALASDKEIRQIPQASVDRLIDPSYAVLPRYWVSSEIIEERLSERWTDGGCSGGGTSVALSTLGRSSPLYCRESP